MKHAILILTLALVAAGCGKSSDRAVAGAADSTLVPLPGNDVPYVILVEALQGNMPQLQALAVETFMESDRTPPLPDIERLADSPDPRVRTTALAMLASTRRREFTPLYQRKARDAEGPVRLAAAMGLAILGDAGQMTLLRDALASTDIPSRRTAVWLLGVMGHPSAIGLLKVKLSDPDAVVVLRAAEAMHALGSGEGLERVRTLTENDRHQVRCYATRLLGEMGEQADIPRLATLCQSRYLDVKFAAIASLALRGDLVRMGLLVDMAGSPDLDARILAARELGRASYTPALAPLGRLLQSQVPLERTTAAAAIVQIRSAGGSWRRKILAETPRPASESAPAPLPGLRAPATRP